MYEFEHISESVTLVDNTSESPEESFETYKVAGTKRKKGILSCGRVYVAILHVMILLLIGLLLNHGFIDSNRSSAQLERSWSPVQDFVEYQESTKHATDPGHNSVYSGPPSEEQEDAWDRLIMPAYLNVSRDELTRAGESFENVIELVGGGYIVSLAVYHELHCLDRYYPNLTETQNQFLKGHLDHCLEVLRMSIMCQGNTVLNSYKWDTEAIDKPMTTSNSRSVCVKWSSIEDWSYDKKVSYSPPVKWPSQNQAQ
ncbi:hypothetical protein FHL15_005452 [Xylaria flabelliformis]|uniref:DUF3328 domain-containing protein n=1 Tax=Xylaria flabelliformis TaxID=2512241 RepID=A0A553I0P3_9PEZI|nr:hypothetical protein FHL15_005452 [Xylaria flabelliformis]